MIELREEIPVEEHKDLQSGFKGFEIKNNTEDRQSEHEGVEFFTPVTFENFEHYYISQKGRLFNSRTKNLIKHTIGNGYPFTILNNNGKSKNITQHRLVALAFIDKTNKNIVNHIDGNKTNNHYKNLEWCTVAENNQHALDTGLRKPVISDKQISEVIEYRKQAFPYYKIAEIFKVTKGTITTTVKLFVEENPEYNYLLKSPARIREYNSRRKFR